MKRSLPLFLVVFVLLVASACALLLVLPASRGADATISAWIPTALDSHGPGFPRPWVHSSP